LGGRVGCGWESLWQRCIQWGPGQSRFPCDGVAEDISQPENLREYAGLFNVVIYPEQPAKLVFSRDQGICRPGNLTGVNAWMTHRSDGMDESESVAGEISELG